LSLKLTILGSGTSHGVPMIACDCTVCTSTDPHDRRTRPSAVFTFDGHNVLIDTAPELRLQSLAHNLRHVDAVLYTHAHADHIVGLDDVRRFNGIAGGALNVYGSAETLARLRRMFAYAFRDEPDYPSEKPHLVPVEVHAPFELFGRSVTPIPYRHGHTAVYGYRINGLAYCPDCNFIPDESHALLTGLDTLILDAPMRRAHPTHFNLEQAIAEARRIGARRTYFTHISHRLPHAVTNAELPAGMELAYDGLVCEVS
jgi:phosphoribosyl 1,2-cyclic phosphate phosphodiesterase